MITTSLLEDMAIKIGYRSLRKAIKISFRSPSSWESPAFVEKTMPLILQSAIVYGRYGRSSHNKNGIGSPWEAAYKRKEIVFSLFACCYNATAGYWISFSTKELIDDKIIISLGNQFICDDKLNSFCISSIDRDVSGWFMVWILYM